MKVYIVDQVLEYENSTKKVQEILSKIDEIIKNSRLILSHLDVNGIIVYSNFHEYILENIHSIDEIHVKTQTHKQMIGEIILSTFDYVDNAIPQIKVLSDEFYATPTESTWTKMSDFLEGIQWIISAFRSIDEQKNLDGLLEDYEIWNIYAKDIFSLKEIIEEFEEILENNDIVSIADILAYEIEPIFKLMKENLYKLVQFK